MFGAATDMLNKMKEIAATDLGGDPADYDVSNERVHQIADESVGYTYAEVAQRAMELVANSPVRRICRRSLLSGPRYLCHGSLALPLWACIMTRGMKETRRDSR